MSYIGLPVLWKNSDTLTLEDLGIESTYADSDIKIVNFRVESIHFYYADKDPEYTCIKVADEDMVIAMPIEDFKDLIHKVIKHNK